MYCADDGDPADLVSACSSQDHSSSLKGCFVNPQIAGGRSLQALLSAKVALLSAIAGSIAVGSCVLNDFFDYSVDVINEPDKVARASRLPGLTSLAAS